MEQQILSSIYLIGNNGIRRYRGWNTWITLADNLVFDPESREYQDYSTESQSLRKVRVTMLEGLQDSSF